ncbi:MAG: response regulator transcription factor [Pseudomonadota bacterium]
MQNVLIIEDHADALEQMTDIVHEAFGAPRVEGVSTLGAARARLATAAFDLVVLDLGLPDGQGEHFIPEVLAVQPNAYIVVSTIHDESERLLTALQEGAKGYLLKEQPRGFLVGEFKGILKGKPPLAPAITRRLLEFVRAQKLETADAEQAGSAIPKSAVDFTDQNSLDSLTEREREVLGLVGKGFNRPEIAGILSISRHTVATHLSKIYEKLGIANRSEAVLAAQQLDLI